MAKAFHGTDSIGKSSTAEAFEVTDAEPNIVACNGTVVEPGGIYLTFSGDTATPYRFAKVVSIGGTGASIGVQIGPDLAAIPSPDLWVKLYYANSVERPEMSEVPAGAFRILPISVAMFLAWGPPKFPIRVGTEAVTAEELAARSANWYTDDDPDSTAAGEDM